MLDTASTASSKNRRALGWDCSKTLGSATHEPGLLCNQSTWSARHILVLIAVRRIVILLFAMITAVRAEEPTKEDSAMSSLAHRAPEFTDLTEHRGNRALHFALELGVWGAGGFWGYEQASGIGGVALAAAIPVATVATWTAFSVPGDPWLPGGRQGTQPRVAIPGWLRLTYELGVHGLSVWAVQDL